ncbi:MAG: host-nuclease inhibitor Gam family protein [Halanaerobiales bacterium]
MALLEKEIQQQEDKERFKVDNDEKANWALRKIKQLTEKKEEKLRFADKEIAKIQDEIFQIEDWLDKQNTMLNKKIEFFEGLLHQYATDLKKEDPDLKTYKLPFGNLQYRKQRPEWNYNEKKLLESCKSAGMKNVIKIEEKINKTKFKKMVTVSGHNAVYKETGEIVEGVKIIERPELFSVKVNV